MMMDNSDDARSNLASLMARRDVIEAELINLHSQLREQNVSMTEPLVDGEGYPRSDVDIYAVRHIRHEIICKENDFKALTKEIENNLYALHAEEKVSTNSTSLNIQQEYSKPFARVDLVDQNSPAQKAERLCVVFHYCINQACATLTRQRAGLEIRNLMRAGVL